MKIELDEATKREVIAQAKAQILADVLKQFNVKQIAAEIRNDVINKAAKEMAQIMYKDVNAERHLHRALASVQDRLNTKVHTMLEKGVTVRFTGLEEMAVADNVGKSSDRAEQVPE